MEHRTEEGDYSILNKNSCLNYLLPEERSDRVIGKLRHPSIFKLSHVHTTRSKTSFINYALDHYIWFYLVVICNLLYFVLCVCLFYFIYFFNPAFGLQLSLINWVELSTIVIEERTANWQTLPQSANSLVTYNGAVRVKTAFVSTSRWLHANFDEVRRLRDRQRDRACCNASRYAQQYVATVSCFSRFTYSAHTYTHTGWIVHAPKLVHSLMYYPLKLPYGLKTSSITVGPLL